ncbi:hypothetical protein LTR78_007914 [Recurvomyces mirabilis]|uniref:Uncharacterized protein n=1 Tax=Recurvomyces mirabilis TaxID=574656 RepID=A0AAE0TUC0_9PEZI|nr:hypothetical protein LTR78_007914 [Recurvomyces mirabilis]KAK5152449.1 hypothetical protein LTS14_008396 [Recurvomyces mirabilis]
MFLLRTLAAILVFASAMPAMTTEQLDPMLSPVESAHPHEDVKRGPEPLAYASGYHLKKGKQPHIVRDISGSTISRPVPDPTTKPTASRNLPSGVGLAFTLIPRGTAVSGSIAHSTSTTTVTRTVSTTFTTVCTSSLTTTLPAASTATSTSASSDNSSNLSSSTFAPPDTTTVAPMSTTSSAVCSYSSGSVLPPVGSLGGQGVLGHVINNRLDTVYVHTSVGGKDNFAAFDDPCDSLGTYPITSGSTYDTAVRAIINGTGGVSLKLGKSAKMDPSNIYQVEYSQTVNPYGGKMTIWFDLSALNGDPFISCRRYMQVTNSTKACNLYNPPGSTAMNWDAGKGSTQAKCEVVGDVYFYLC